MGVMGLLLAPPLPLLLLLLLLLVLCVLLATVGLAAQYPR
jgi:hypothetical protein